MMQGMEFGAMARQLKWQAVALAGLLSACAYHLASPIADFEARLIEPPVPEGRYCNLTAEGELDPDCAVLVWHADTRMFEMRDEGGEEPPTQFSLVGLSEGLVAAEVISEDMPYPYQVYLFAHTEDAFVFLPIADDEGALMLAERYPGVELSEQEGIYVTGEAEAVRAFLNACARMALAMARVEGDEPDIAVYAPDKTEMVTPAQLKSRERLLALADQLADEAPELEPVE